MKAVFEKIEKGEANSLVVRQFEVPMFDAPFHFHPEYELTLILKGEGQRYVGQQVANFTDGDLAFLGSNLPHCWIAQKAQEEEMLSAIVVQFDENCLGKDFFQLPEMTKIKAFLQHSKAGFQLLGETKEVISQKMQALVSASPIQKIMGLIAILAYLSENQNRHIIDTSFSEHQYSQIETVRFQKVFSYLIEHFKEEITLDQIAAVAHLSPTSFCRYFKGITQKTFVEVLVEFRLQYACQLLTKTDLPIQQIAYDSGFGDVPYFNRQFKKHTGTSPQKWREESRKR